MSSLAALTTRVVVAFCCLAPAFGATIKVSQNGAITTIQGGINAAGPGDTVQVKAGLYRENVLIPAGKDGLVLKVKGNVILDARPAGGAGAGPGIVVQSADVRIQGLSIRDAGVDSGTMAPGVGIRGEADGLQVIGVAIAGCQDGGIHVDGADAVVRKCSVAGGLRGIVLEGAGAVVEQTTVRDSFLNGLSVTGSSLRVRDCTIEGCWDDGLTTEGTGADVRNNTIRNCGGDGWAHEGDEASGFKNTITGADLGINIASNAVVLRKNVVTDTETGISGFGNEGQVDQNQVRQAREEGIAWLGDGTYVIDNVIEHCGLTLLHYIGDQAVVADNQLRFGRDGAAGIRTESVTTGGFIIGNDIQDCTGNGIKILSSCTGLLVQDNELRRCGAAHTSGVEVDGTGHLLTGNRARDGAGDGFFLIGGGNELDANQALDNGRDGFDVAAGANNNVLTSNTAKGNLAEGLDNGGSLTTANDNLLTGNRLDVGNSGSFQSFSGNTIGDGSGSGTPPEID